MSEAFRLVLNAENAVPELAIALLTIYDVVAASCVAPCGIKDAMQEAGHAFSATKYRAKAEHMAFCAEKDRPSTRYRPPLRAERRAALYTKLGKREDVLHFDIAVRKFEIVEP